MAMKFVTDLSKGVLGTPDSPILWANIISNVPDSLLLKPDFRCLVVACGHCTEALLLVKRMQSLGIPNSRIQDAIWVLDKYSVFTNQARKYGFKNIITADFLAWDSKGMRFDLVMGNPPYQTTKDHGKKVTGNGNLWVHFIIRSIDLLKDNGTLTMITPDSWMAPTYDVMGSRQSIFNDYFKKYDLTVIEKGNSDWFTGIGISPAYFTLVKRPYSGKTSINGQDVDISNLSFIPKNSSPVSLSIHSKVLSSSVNERQLKMRWSLDITSTSQSTTKSSKFQYLSVDSHCYKPLRYANQIDPNQSDRKILIPYTGNYQVIVDDKGELGASPQVSIMLLEDYETKESVESFYWSKLIRFIMQSNRWTQYILSQILNCIPITDLTRTWTDQELYDHFGLTEEEIRYIEEQVK